MRQRTHFSVEQIHHMQVLFQFTRYPSRDQYEDLAKRIDIDEKSIKVRYLIEDHHIHQRDGAFLKR